MEAAVGHGKVLAPDDLGVTGAGPWAIVTADGCLRAVYEACLDGRVKPTVVLPPAERADEAAGGAG